MRTRQSLLLLLGIFLLSACGSGTNESPSGDNHSTPIATTIKGGRTGGAWAVFTEGIAEVIRREQEGSYITVEPGSIVENPSLVGTNTVPYGLSYTMTSYSAYRGEEPYTSAFEDIRAVSVIVPANYFQFLVTEDSGIDSLAEIIEEAYPIRLAVNQKGSDAERITRAILHHNGVTYDDIISWGGSIHYVSASKALEMMADGRIDAFGNAESAPSSTIIEAATTTDLNILSFEDESVQAVSEELGMEVNTIPSGTYSFLVEDVNTISTPAILITHKDVPDEEVYRVVESIYNNLDYLQSVHKEFNELTEENMSKVGEVPLHPGAEQFFKDKGFLNPQ